MKLINKDDRFFVAGHRGMAGSAVCRALQRGGYNNVLRASRQELDLLDLTAVQHWFAKNKPNNVVLAAAKVGGIHANDTYPADFLLENLKIQTNVIETAWRSGVKRLLFLGSSCIYPKFAEQPIKEESLLTGSLEATNEWYAIAKIAGIKLCDALRTGTHRERRRHRRRSTGRHRSNRDRASSRCGQRLPLGSPVAARTQHKSHGRLAGL